MVTTMKINAPAKINISLDVLRRRDDGYHDVKMIMQSISLFDIIDVETNSSGEIKITSNKDNIPLDERNIAYKAVRLFLNEAKENCGVNIHIEKHIPVAAGLAGGSTNAAAVLIALNEIFDKRYTEDKLMDMGAKLGADVPFCIMQGTALSEGIGEKLSKLPAPNIKNILLVKPPIDVSTKWVYENLDLKNSVHPDIDKAVEIIKSGNVSVLSNVMGNILESVTVKKHPVIAEIKTEMKDLGATMSMMSGSGPSVFGFFENEANVKKAYDFFKNKYDEVFLINSYNV